MKLYINYREVKKIQLITKRRKKPRKIVNKISWRNSPNKESNKICLEMQLNWKERYANACLSEQEIALS